MYLTAMDLCSILRDRSAFTRAFLANGYDARIYPSEESITDVNLVEISRRASDYIYTKKFTKHEESSVSGADWLWVFGNGKRWLSLLIQAKKVPPRATRVATLHHSTAHGLQRATLQSFASREGLHPLYVFYSALSQGQMQHPYYDADEMGCFIVSEKVVRVMEAEGRTATLRKLLPRATPWHCLACQCFGRRGHAGTSSGDAQPDDFAAIVADTVFRLDRDSRELDESPDEQHYPVISDCIPPIVRQYISDEGGSLPRPLSSVSIVSSVPLITVSEIADTIARDQIRIG